ncbi:hypothetical protein DIZ76_014937 [Coccidioides immitis]|nr:hypothetical protein DIZ76_014937 [Coccidioides immitis]
MDGQNLPRPPTFPVRPDLFNEVEWGPLPSDKDIALAYKLWIHQDGLLGKEVRYDPGSEREDEPEDDGPDTCLVRNVYEALMQLNPLPFAKSQQVETAQFRHEYIASDESDASLGSVRAKGWSYKELFGMEYQNDADEPELKIEINGLDLHSSRWRKAGLQKELRARHLDTNGTVAELKERLRNSELDNYRLGAKDIDKGSRLPRQTLLQWGCTRTDDYMLKISTETEFSPVDMYTWAILLSPYNPAYWTSRAFVYYQMGHLDLALGDAHRAQLLCDVITNPLVRNSQPGLYTRIWDAIERHILQIKYEGVKIAPEIKKLRDVSGVSAFIPHVRKSLHHMICLSLLTLQCWEDYQTIEGDQVKRITMRDRDSRAIQERQQLFAEFVKGVLKEKREDPREFFYESHYGHIPGKPYPYYQPIARTSNEVINNINKEIIGNSQSIQLGPCKIEVRGKSDRQLGVFAREYIKAGEVVYADEPSIRGHLHDFHRRKEYRCENCKRRITAVPNNRDALYYIKNSLAEARALGIACECALSKSEPLFWCNPPRSLEADARKPEDRPHQAVSNAVPRSRKRGADGEDDSGGEREPKRQKTGPFSCFHVALTHYHYRTCGRDWKWLQDAMRPVKWALAERTPRLHYTNERHGTVLSLMLREVFDITLERRETDGKPNLLAYEIDELFPLMGADKEIEGHIFPFSFAANIKVPFDILQCLGVNIFRDMTFDTWVIQLVLRKLLINTIPWDLNRRVADVVDTPESKELRRNRLPSLPEIRFSEADPTIKDLYIFPGVSMFNSACPDQHNVNWDWDLAVPNRMVLWATRDIEEGEELLIPYVPMKIGGDFAQRMFGVGCRCSRCKDHPIVENVYRTLGPYGDSSSEDSEENTADNSGDDNDGGQGADGNNNKGYPITGEEESSSEPFATQRAMTPNPEDEGEYDEADFREESVQAKDHSGVPFTEAVVSWHADKLRTALKKAAKRLPRHRRGATDEQS